MDHCQARIDHAERGSEALQRGPRDGLRVLLLIHNLELGGAQVAIRHLAEGLMAGGCRPIVCGWRRGGEQTPVLEESGVPVEAPVASTGAWGLLRAPGYLRGLVRRHRIDLIHAHMSDSAVLAMVLQFLCRTPFVITHHSNDLTDNLDRQGVLYAWMRHRLLCASAQRAAVNIAVSASVGDQLTSEARLEADRIAVVPSGVPSPATESVVEARRECAARSGSEGAYPTVLFLGRLAREKGADLLVAAAPAILARFPRARFAFVGEGPAAPMLKAQSEALGVGDSVVMVGPTRDAGAWLAKADLLAEPSSIEGLSLAVLEAMSWGVPVVATDIPGNRDLIGRDVYGRLCEAGSSASLATALIAALEDREASESRARRARDLVRDRHGTQAMARRHLEIYTAVLGGGPIPRG